MVAWFYLYTIKNVWMFLQVSSNSENDFHEVLTFLWLVRHSYHAHAAIVIVTNHEKINRDNMCDKVHISIDSDNNNDKNKCQL